MIKELIPRVGEMPYLCYEDTVVITGCNGALSKKNGQQIVIDFVLANSCSRRYKLATITIDDDYCRYCHNYAYWPLTEFLDIVKEKYPQFFEYLLFHPEFIR